MPELLDRQPEHDRVAASSSSARPALPPPFAPTVETDERAARRSLRDQIERLEQELGDLFATTFPREGFEWGVRASRGGPRLLPLAELERVRDSLADRLERNRRQLDERAELEERNLRTFEEMMLEPERFKWRRLYNDDLGMRGCGARQVLPRYGVLGILFNWWRVRISSGCPLAGGHGHRP